MWGRGGVVGLVLASCLLVASPAALSNATGKGVVPCDIKQFACNNGNCVPHTFTCDSEDDCGDRSDEAESLCVRSKECKNEEFSCKSGEQCIPTKWLCDAEKDCADGSDEDEQICKLRTCSPDQFTCRSSASECVPLTWMCDGTADCKDQSDEKACNNTCRADEFTCDNGKCIQKGWKCDQDVDCDDGSDEKDCPKITCANTEVQCGSSLCIAAHWRCDGDPDCSDGSDEKDCPVTWRPTTAVVCRPEEFMCDDHITCIRHRWVCDGSKDCPNGSDEAPERCANMTCRADQFQCANKACVAGLVQCDGRPDCADGSDELDCPTPRPAGACNRTLQFDCGGGTCIPLDKVCDGHQDCPANEDEPRDSCNRNECLIDNGGCSHGCIDLMIGHRCDCPRGFELRGNSSCEDIDECQQPGSCSQICINEKGAFKCECHQGYMRDPRDLTRCKSTEGHASLLFARRRDIRKISLDHHEMTSIVNETYSATALDYVFRTGMIFWSDVAEQKIYKAPIDEGSQKVAVIEDEVSASDGLAVDWIYNHIYWTDTGKNTIELANFEGQMRKVLIEDQLEEPRGIALNPADGWMFWTDWGAEPRIERAGMDGSHRQVIVSYDVKWPNGLTLDLVKRRVLWVDAKLNVISSCDYSGANRRVILYSVEYLKHPFSITTFEDWMYWTDWDRAAIFKANKFNGADVQPVTAVGMLRHPMTVHVYHPYRQPDAQNHCQAVNGHCSHLCLPAPLLNEHSPRISCACPDGLKLLPDGLTCAQETISTANTTLEPIYNRQPDEPHPTSTSKNATSSNGGDVPSGESDDGQVAIIVIAVVLAVITIFSAIIYLIYRHYIHRNMTSMNFDNPVYRKTTEDQFSLEKNSYPARLYPSTVGEEAQEPLTGQPLI